MAIDLEKERQRLSTLYADMPSPQLEQIASQPSELTDIAQEALRTELERRQLTPLGGNHSKTTDDDLPNTKLVIVRTYRNLPDAHLAKGSLESVGLECFLADDNMVAMDWFKSDAIGGVKLLVNETDVPEAIAVLSQPAPESFEVDGIGEFQQPNCPQCGSSDISLGAPSYANAELFSDPPPAQGWYCAQCKHIWNEAEEASDE